LVAREHLLEHAPSWISAQPPRSFTFDITRFRSPTPMASVCISPGRDALLQTSETSENDSPRRFFERALKLFLDGRAHGLELCFVFLAQLVEPVDQRRADRVLALDVGVGEDLGRRF